MDRRVVFPLIVENRGREQCDRIACRFFSGPALASDDLTYGQLWTAASSLAQHYREAELEGRRALLICRSQRSFVIAFYACLLAGVVAIPSAVPKRRNLVQRLQMIANDAGAFAVISDVIELIDANGGLTGMRVFDLNGTRDAPSDFVNDHCNVVNPSKPAFLQYTSGSTGDPKGVIISHGNLVANCHIIAEAMELDSNSLLFTALPLFHDMGLVGGVLQMMFTGCSASFLPPVELVQYPERWLRIISDYGITVSGGPNFMYELAATAIRPEHLNGVDLSRWRVAFCGAEPIRASTIERFTTRFRDVGFSPGAFYPCYGMAESTLFITGGHVGAPPVFCEHATGCVVGCGVPRGDTQLDIVDPQTQQRVGQGEVGEIWVRGTSVAMGYWDRPDLSLAAFQARLAGDDAPNGGYLRTGDLGFVLDGSLFVTGRLKDLIVLNGKKIAPQDIEEHCERAHTALRQGGGAAFSIDDAGVERLVIVFEVKREWVRRLDAHAEVRQVMKSIVMNEFALPVLEVALLPPGALPRTSSGKVRRSKCRLDYLDGTLERIDADAVA